MFLMFITFMILNNISIIVLILVKILEWSTVQRITLVAPLILESDQNNG
jgi:hypothetical protein